MPILIRSLLKDAAKAFMNDNEVDFPEQASRDELLALIREHFGNLGLNVEYFDFQDRVMLQPGSQRSGVHPQTTSTSESALDSGPKRQRNFPPPEPFDLEPQNNAAGRFEKWLERFRIYGEAIDLSSETTSKQRSIFLHVAGEKVMDLVPTLCEDVSIEDLLQRVQVALALFFRPKKNRHYERQMFRAATQTSDETTDAYVSRLRQQATHCEYGESLDDRILEQLIASAHSPELKSRLYEKGDGLNLASALETARNFECISKQSQQMSSQGAQYFSANCNFVQKPLRPCRYCYTKHYFKKKLCPAAGNRCKACGGDNHFPGSACSNAKESPQRTKKNAPKKKAKGKRNTRWKKVRNMEQDETESSDEDEPDSGPLFVSAIDSSKPGLYISLSVGKRSVPFLLDTGATNCNLLPKSFLPSNVSLQPCEPIRLYGGSVYEGLLGKTVVRVRNPKTQKSYNLVFGIVEEGKPILGWPAIKRMRLLKVSCKQVEVNRVEATGEKSLNFMDLVAKHEPVFRDELGKIDGVEVIIKLKPDAQPVFCRPRSVPYAYRGKVEEALQKLVEKGTIEEVQRAPDWCSPICCAVKKDSSIRVCADFSVTLNKVMQVDEYPLPTSEEIFSQLHGCRYFTRLDFRCCYEQLVVKESCRKYLCINTPKGIFRYIRLPYGISSGPSVCQRAIEEILRTVHKETSDRAFGRIDDIVLGSPTRAGLYALTDRVLTKLERLGARLNLEKCLFGVEEMTFLGFHVSAKGIQPDPAKISCILEAKPPTSKTNLRSFVGLVNFYRKFCPRLSEVSRPLYELLKQDVDFVWCDAHQKAFEEIKRLVTTAPVLTFYNPKLRHKIQSDASPFAIGSCLTQIDADGIEKPVAYAHRALTNAERNYSQLDKEALSLVFGLSKFHCYVFGKEVILETDHRPLLRILGHDSARPGMVSSRLARYAVFLSQYRYSISFKPGTNNENADALSRLISSQGDEQPDEASVFCVSQLDSLPVTEQQIHDATQDDHVLSEVVLRLKEGWSDPVSDPSFLPYYRRRDELSLHNDVIFWGNRAVIPNSLRGTLLTELHKGHPGIVRMSQLARRLVWWPNLDQDIEQKVSQCDPCQENRSAPARVPVLSWPSAEGPWQRIHVDYAPKFHGRALLIVIDSYSRWVEVGITRTNQISTEKTIEMLKGFMARYGLPKEIVSDNGVQFTSRAFREFCASIGCKQKFTAIYSPSTNGQAENTVKTVKKGLSKILSEKKQNITNALENLLFQIRNTPHSTTGSSPALLFLGRELRSRLSLVNESVVEGGAKTKTQPPVPTSDLRKGHHVRFQNFSGTPKWKKGTIMKVEGPRHFQIRDVEGNIHRRHRNQMFPTVENTRDIGPGIREVVGRANDENAE